MTCRRCGRALDEADRFCPGCGTAIGGDCSSCGTSLAADARFCGRCGEPVERTADGSSSAGRVASRERKVATLLFADLVDFTAMGEVHDPERVAALVGETFERLGREVRRYEGTVEKFAGDALLAVFGVPAAHEDDPERSVRAALEMQAVMSEHGSSDPGRPRLTLRIGIETGEVLVDQARASAERDLFVTGDAVNTAARLQAAAEPGTVVVGAATHHATRSVIDFEELPPLELKGKAEPVMAWRVLATKDGLGDRRSPLGMEAPLTGRDEELARVERAVGHAFESRRPHLVTIMGSAGVGKSRLARELQQHLEDKPERYHWRKGRCLAYADRGFGPIADVVKADAGISDDDAPGVAASKLAARLAQLPIDAEAEDVRAGLELVLGIGGRELPRDALFDAWRRYLQAIAALDPLVLLVEDIHWADDAMLAFLDLLARWGEGPMVILCLSRHELLEVRPGWATGLPESTTIILEPLGAEASESLMQSLLGERVPTALKHRIADLAEGNPLFAEETARMLVDDGTLRFEDGAWRLARSVEQIDIPDSVHAVLAARLDSLPAGERRAAQLAAVVGRVFWDRLVADLNGKGLDATGEQLRGLRRKDLVMPREPSRLAGAREFAFRHVLIRDVAYESLSKRDRAWLHRDIAHWVEAVLTDRIDEFIELVASHLASAEAYEEEVAVLPATELRALGEQTFDAELQAARRASSLGLSDRACDWYRQTIDLAGKLGRFAHDVAQLADEDIGTHSSLSRPDHVPRLSRVIGDLEAVAELTDEDEELLARLRSAQAQALDATGDDVGARALLREGIAQLDDGRPSSGRARLRRTLGRSYWLHGPAEEAVPVLEMAIAEARAADDGEAERWAIHDLGIARGVVGRDDAIELVEQSYELALEAGDRALIHRCCTNLPSMRWDRMEAMEPILAMTKEALEFGRLESGGVADHWPAHNLSKYVCEAGRLDESLAYMEEAMSAARSRGLPPLTFLNGRAVLHRLRGEIAEAERDEATLEELGREQDDVHNIPYQLLGRAWAQWPDDPSVALSGLVSAWSRSDLHDPGNWLTTWVARMSLRLGDQSVLAEAVSRHRRQRRPGATALEAHDRVIDGLIAEDGGRTTEKGAEVVEQCGYVQRGLEAWTDAALLAARAGRSSMAHDRAVDIMRRTGLHPLLGPLPETRWLAATTPHVTER